MDESRPLKDLKPVQRIAALALASGERHDEGQRMSAKTVRETYNLLNSIT